MSWKHRVPRSWIEHARAFASRFRWGKYEFRGRFSDWSSAEAFLHGRGQTGYANRDTADKYVTAALRSLASVSGPAPERIRQLDRLLDTALHTAQLSSAIRILDFGGAAGGEFLQLRTYFPRYREFQWVVCDLPEIAARAEEQIAPLVDGLTFVSDVAQIGHFDVLYTSGALQYIRDWQATVDQFLAYRPACVVCTRVPIYDGRSFVSCQNAGETYYPAWVWSRADFMRPLDRAGYRLSNEFYVPQDRLVLDGRTLIDQFHGFVLVRQS